MFLGGGEQTLLQIFLRVTNWAGQIHRRPEITCSLIKEYFVSRSRNRFQHVRHNSDTEFAIDISVLDGEVSFDSKKISGFNLGIRHLQATAVPIVTRLQNIQSEAFELGVPG